MKSIETIIFNGAFRHFEGENIDHDKRLNGFPSVTINKNGDGIIVDYAHFRDWSIENPTWLNHTIGMKLFDRFGEVRRVHSISDLLKTVYRYASWVDHDDKWREALLENKEIHINHLQERVKHLEKENRELRQELEGYGEF